MSSHLDTFSLVRRLHGMKPLSIGLAILIFSSMVMAVASFIYLRNQHDAFVSLRAKTRDVRILQQAISDAHVVWTTTLAGGQPSTRAFDSGVRTIDGMAEQIADFDSYLSKQPGYTAHPIRKGVDELLAVWHESQDLTRAAEFDKARTLMTERRISAVYATAQDGLERFWADHTAKAKQLSANSEWLTNAVTVLQVGTGLWSLLGIWLVYRMSAAEAAGRSAAQRAGEASRARMVQLFQMADMLQSASGPLDANAVLKATTQRLLPGLSGALYVFNNSRDRLDRSTTFGPSACTAAEFIAPSQCWALKRGKAHVNDLQEGCLCCDHDLPTDKVVLEIPMTARGELLGLLQVGTKGADAVDVLEQHREIAVAIADGMSLALANIALREKLRSQALRDPLTGLYNRRYMEDSLQRLQRLAERENKSLSVLMIDLDHFKKLNDTHGHAMGDAVLRETSAAIQGALRESDIACRYGGEELIVILPDCALDDALAKAETIRANIQDLSGHHGTSVSASIGVSAMPERATSADLISSADAALYAAKKAGRNCVVAARSKAGAPAQDNTAPAHAADMLVAAE